MTQADKRVQQKATIWSNPFNAEPNLLDIPDDSRATELELTLNERRAGEHSNDFALSTSSPLSTRTSTTPEQKLEISETSTPDSLRDTILYSESLSNKNEVQTVFNSPTRLRKFHFDYARG